MVLSDWPDTDTYPLTPTPSKQNKLYDPSPSPLVSQIFFTPAP